MDWLNNMSNASLLALAGGAAATIGVFWSRAKEVASYLSSFVLVTAHYDYVAGQVIRRYLKSTSDYKRLPGGDLSYEVVFNDIAGRPAGDRRVPMRHKLIKTNLLVGIRGGLLIAQFNDDQISVTGLRLWFNADDFVSRALDWSTYSDGKGAAYSRFRVSNVVGCEKGTWVNSPVRGQDAAESPVAMNRGVHLDADLDVSFKYDRKLWSNTRTYDPFEHLFYPPEILRHVADLELWKESGEWFNQRGIPWRRGILFHGMPGTGKSSLAKAIAQKLGMPLYVYHLATLSDQEFTENWGNMSGPCMALFEDFDTVFNGREALTSHGALTFECVLNAISGVNTQTGVILAVTTNHIDHIDDAMKNRPGRIDAVVEIGPMGENERQKLAAKILCDWPDVIRDTVAQGQGMAAVQFSELCVQRAFHIMSTPPADERTTVVTFLKERTGQETGSIKLAPGNYRILDLEDVGVTE